MSMHPLLAQAQMSSLRPEPLEFDIGDTIKVHVRIKEGDKERTQIFEGIAIARRGAGVSETFTVRRIVEGEGVERVFPINSPKIAKVEVKRRAIVRRAKLYFLRDRVGKKAFTLKEKLIQKETVGRKRTRVKARKQKQADAAAVAALPAEPEKKNKKAKKKAAEKAKE